jgi:hypothetical protein
MTLDEISRHYKMCEQLGRYQEILDGLKAKAEPGASVITGMPHGSGVSDKVGSIAISIADMESQIAQLRQDIRTERTKIDRYISGIEDARIRITFRLRFVDCCSWKEVADCLGPYYTEESVRQLCYRFFRVHNDG